MLSGKRMLKRLTRQFISFEKGITSMNTFKHRLKRKFKVKLKSVIIHSQLYKHKQQLTESKRQYIYVMQEIADQGHIEKDALIQYIIDSVQDDDYNKMVLYNAKTICELKKCFEIYDCSKKRQ